MTVQAGKLRQRITIQQRTGTEDDAGQVIDTWSNWLANEPADVDGTGGTEVVRGHQRVEISSYRITMRYRSGLTEDMRIIWGSETLMILRIANPDGRNRKLVIDCREAE